MLLLTRTASRSLKRYELCYLSSLLTVVCVKGADVAGRGLCQYELCCLSSLLTTEDVAYQASSPVCCDRKRAEEEGNRWAWK